jgi:P27 family predicted phage terminase small subunit
MRTKPRTPAALLKLRGNPTRRPIPLEPDGVGDLWDAPPWFDDETREAWRYAVDHAPLGLLTGTDRDVMIVWVVATVEHKRAADNVAKLGSVVQRSDGKVVINPYATMMQRQALIVLRACQELGFSPSARAHLGARAPEFPNDPVAPRGVAGDLAVYLAEKPDRLN